MFDRENKHSFNLSSYSAKAVKCNSEEELNNLLDDCKRDLEEQIEDSVKIERAINDNLLDDFKRDLEEQIEDSVKIERAINDEVLETIKMLYKTLKETKGEIK